MRLGALYGAAFTAKMAKKASGKDYACAGSSVSTNQLRDSPCCCGTPRETHAGLAHLDHRWIDIKTSQ
jgi:hypothetical protein